jgi:hypothetical protein
MTSALFNKTAVLESSDLGQKKGPMYVKYFAEEVFTVIHNAVTLPNLLSPCYFSINNT